MGLVSYTIPSHSLRERINTGEAGTPGASRLGRPRRTPDRLYRPQSFTTERERVEHLLSRYEKLAVPLTAKDKPKRLLPSPHSP